MRKLLYILTFFFTISSSYAQDETYDLTVTSVHTNEFLQNTSNYSTVFEGCTDITVKIFRPLALSLSYPIDIPVTLSGTAKLNVDYTLEYNDGVSLTSASGSVLTMNASARDLIILIKPIHDGVLETPESIVFNLAEVVVPGIFKTNEKTLEFTVKDQPKLNLTVSTDTSVKCSGEEVTIDASVSGGVAQYMRSPFITYHPYAYEWDQIGTDRVQPVNPLQTTDYKVTATDICGTQFVSKSVNVEVPIYPEIEASLDSAYICEKDTKVDLCVSDIAGGEGNSYTYDWKQANNNTTLSNNKCLNATAGNYIVTISDVCKSSPLVRTNSIYLDEAPIPEYEFLSVPDSAIKLEFNNLTPTKEGLTHEWFFKNTAYDSVNTFYIANQYPVVVEGENTTSVLVGDSINPVTFNTPGTYEVNLKVTTVAAGCYKEYSEYITLEPSYFFYAPNAFTPNGDDVNDAFRPIVTGTKKYEFFVYDGYGKLVFSSSNVLKQWDGTYKGKPAAEGVYVYKVVMTKNADVVVFSEQGSVTLLR